MVEFVKKTIAAQDCTLDATYGDMYDGSSPYLKIGGISEVKKALMRFQISEKPTYGDAVLKHGELGFYTTGVTFTGGGIYPEFNIYKLKSSPDGKDWGASGKIRNVPRGRQIIKVDLTNNWITIKNHQLQTGDRIWWSPVTARYDDCDILPLIPEKEYYAIRINNDQLGIATTIANAIAYSASNTSAAQDFTSKVPDNTSGPWGYVRSDKYAMDIHVVSAHPSSRFDSIAESFDGSEYRETDLGFTPIMRNVVRNTSPFLTETTDLVDNPNDDAKQGSEGSWKTLFIGSIRKESSSNLMDWYASPKGSGKIPLVSNQTNADGTGWWKTVEPAPWGGGGHDYVKKGASTVKWETETMSEPLPYGDEVTPMNSMFHRVTGAAEFQHAGVSAEETENDLQATGAIRFSSTKKLTGGQSCNIYQFWKEDAVGTSYPSGGAIETDDRQECMMLYKGIPFPTKNWANIESGNHGHGQYPIQNLLDFDQAGGEDDLCVSMTVNFDKLEKAWTTGAASSTDDITTRRGFHVIFCAVPPESGESFYDYLIRIKASSGFNDADCTGLSACGFSIINTNVGLRLFPLDNSGLTFSNSGDFTKDAYFNNVTNAQSTALDYGTDMEEGQWYTLKVFFPAAVYQQGALVIEDQDGNQVQDKATIDQSGYPPIALRNLKDFTGNAWYAKGSSKGTYEGEFKAAHDWWHNMSIWVTNTKTGYDSVGEFKGIDWMADEEDRDTSTNIYIDNISVTGVNLEHQNATVGQVGGSRSRIYIAGNHKYNSSGDKGNVDVFTGSTNGAKYSPENRETRSDSMICLGFEDPSQLISNHRREKSWRYLFWHGYQSSNLSSDNQLTWSANQTLPDTDNSTSTTVAKGWFTNLPANTYLSQSDDTFQSFTDNGMPYTFGEVSNKLSPSISVTYSDAHVSLGAQASDEAMDTRELWHNLTPGGGAAMDTPGRKGTNKPMFMHSPRIGIIFDGNGVNIVNDKIYPTRTLTGSLVGGGPNDGNTVFWQSGQKVVYFDGGLSTVIGIDSATGLFNDTPTPYYWESGSATGAYGYLHATFAEAIADPIVTATRIDLANGQNGTHYLYEWDYYMNRKYFNNGFSSKGFNQMIIEPVLSGVDSVGGGQTHVVNDKFLAPNQYLPIVTTSGVQKDDSGSHGGTDTALSSMDDDERYLEVTKRENIFCAAKILGVEGGATPDGSAGGGTITARVDTVVPLRSTPDTNYIVWFAGSENNAYYKKSGLKIKIVDSEHIQIFWNGKAEDITTIMTANTYGDGLGGGKGVSSTDTGNVSTGLSRLWIGPEKYWLNIMIRNQGGDTYDTTTSSTFANLPNKTYSSVSLAAPFGTTTYLADEYEHGDDITAFDAWGVPGATYNESTINFDELGGVKGAYINQWSPAPSMDSNATLFDLQDYGFGAVALDTEGKGGDNGVVGGYAGRFTPRENSVNRVKLNKIFSVGEAKVEGDYLDLAMQQETLSSNAVMSIASSDNNAYPKPFLLTVFEDIKPENPTEFTVTPYEKDAFHPEFKWSASDGDLWYGFIIVDDVPINNQYHRSILHVPMNEDLRTSASSYSNTKGWYYSAASNAEIYGHRYYNTTKAPSGVFAGSALLAGNHSGDYGAFDSNERRTAVEAYIWDNVEGLAGNTKHFDGTSYLKYSWDAEDSTNSTFTYPVDEMSIVAHITPNAWSTKLTTSQGTAWEYNNETTIEGSSGCTVGLKIGMMVSGLGIPDGAYIVSIDDDEDEFVLSGTTTGGARTSQTLTFKNRNYICSLNEANDTTAVRDSWGMYIDDEGQINAFIGAAAAVTHPTTYIELKSTTKVPIDGTPTNIILTVDTQIHSGNVKLFINGRLEDQSGMRGTLSKNNWPTDADGLGGENIFYDTNGDEDLYIGTKSASSAVAQHGFEGKMEEFTLYDKAIYPVIPQNGSFVLDKPLEELSVGSSSSSKAHVARLFIKDYHNIRGKTTEEVAASSQVSFKKAAFELNTVVV